MARRTPRSEKLRLKARQRRGFFAWFTSALQFAFSFKRRRVIRRRSGGLRSKKLGAVQQGASERGVVAAPGALQVGLALEVGAHGLHFGVQVVHVMQQERFREHGQLGGAKLILAMVADDEVLEQRLELGRKVRNQRKFRLQHLEFNDHVAEKLAARGVGKRAVVSEFVNFTDVMKKDAGQKQIAIDLRVVSADQVARAK